MFKPALTVCALTAIAMPGLARVQVQAQIPSVTPNCLHAADETAANRARRQQALQYATKLNAAEAMATLGAPPPQRQRSYRQPNEFVTLPAVPAGFDLQFHLDGNSYGFSLKDTRDACHYAIFSDQDKLIYEAIPTKAEVTLLPLGTR